MARMAAHWHRWAVSSCTTATACTAVGYDDIGGPANAMAQEWNGTN